MKWVASGVVINGMATLTKVTNISKGEFRTILQVRGLFACVHNRDTREGKKRGKTKADFFKAEQAALEPLQPGLFDHLIEG